MMDVQRFVLTKVFPNNRIPDILGRLFCRLTPFNFFFRGFFADPRQTGKALINLVDGHELFQPADGDASRSSGRSHERPQKGPNGLATRFFRIAARAPATSSSISSCSKPSPCGPLTEVRRSLLSWADFSRW